MKNTNLFYIHDPMCSWCWGFGPVLQRLFAALPADLEVKRILGGLAPDSGCAMPEEMQQYLQQTWRAIQERIPGTRFNYDYWSDCTPRRSTYPACRGVIAARQQGLEHDEKMTVEIQKAYFLQAKNPSDDSTLIGLAELIGLDLGVFTAALHSAETRQTLADEIDFTRRLDVQGFPSLVMVINDTVRRINVDYIDSKPMLDTINSYLSG